MSQCREIPDGTVEGYRGTSKRPPASPNAKALTSGAAVDHGPVPSTNAAKRLKLGSPAKLPPQKSKHSTPLHEGRCCNCTSKSTCQRNCECRKSKRQCSNCDCFGRCRNKKLDFKAALCRSTTQESSPESAETQSPVEFLSSVTPQSSPDDDDPPGLSEPRRLDLEEKSLGSPLPPAPPRKGQQEDILHEDRENGDIPGAVTSDADQLMDKVYGDHVHQNPGTHLCGDIADDALWQERWRQLVSFPSHVYDVPNGAVGKQFIEKLVLELRGIVSPQVELRAILDLSSRDPAKESRRETI
jgi:hypothetical protein